MLTNTNVQTFNFVTKIQKKSETTYKQYSIYVLFCTLAQLLVYKLILINQNLT